MLLRVLADSQGRLITNLPPSAFPCPRKQEQHSQCLAPGGFCDVLALEHSDALVEEKVADQVSE